MYSHRQFVPRSVLDREHWDALAQEPSLTGLIGAVRKAAEGADPRPSPPLATDFLAARRSNERVILDRWWQEGRPVLAALAVRRLLRGIEPDDPDDVLLNTLWVHATQPTWVVSAHLPNFDLPASDRVTIDLAAAEMAADLAEMCETLGPWMDSVSGTLRGRILHEIDERVLEPFGDGMALHWADGGSNWSGVCAGSILAACQSFEAMDMPRPQAKERALDVLSLYLQKGFTEHGECDEGVGYWKYGLAYAVMGWMRLSPDEYARHVDHARLAQVADYPRRAHLYGEAFYAGNDGDMVNACPYWLAEALAQSEGQEWLLSWAALHSSEEPPALLPFSPLLRMAAFSQAEGAAAMEAAEETVWLHDQQTAILRGMTSAGEIIGILSGGHNAERHNHNDVGHFSVILNGRPIVPDLGNRYYTSDYFGPKRYTYLAASSRGHNCPIVQRRAQRTGRGAMAVVMEWNPDAAFLELSASEAYPDVAGLLVWRRSLARSGDGAEIVISDRFSVLEPGSEIISRVWSSVPIIIESLGVFRLDALRLEVTPPPLQESISTVDGTDEELRAFAGVTLYCLDLRYATDEARQAHVTLTFSAHSGGDAGSA